MVQVKHADRMMINAQVIDSHLIVRFADGLQCRVPTEDLTIFGKDLNLENIKLPSPYQLKISREDNGEVEILWDFIRRYDDQELVKREEGEADETWHKLGQRIKELRKNAGLSQEQLAKRAGITRQTISRIETGQTSTTYETLKKIANSLNLSFPEFLSSNVRSVEKTKEGKKMNKESGRSLGI